MLPSVLLNAAITPFLSSIAQLTQLLLQEIVFTV